VRQRCDCRNASIALFHVCHWRLIRMRSSVSPPQSSCPWQPECHSGACCPLSYTASHSPNAIVHNVVSEGAVLVVDDAYRAVRIWLWCVAGLVLAMILVGGATRLTGSGLSITEWRPFMGAIPPLSDAAWQAEFDKYRAIPQYKLLNKGMSLGDFQFIYWWEWGHRQLGRFVGFAYMLPLAFFWLRGAVKGKLAVWLLALGLLGGFQGAIGWIMVASGLKEGMISVAPVKLALHLTTACLILVGLVWTARALRLVGNMSAEVSHGTSRGAFSAKVLLVLLVVQIALGALVAGSKSGLTYNTWPLMDGAFIPSLDALFVVKPWIENFVANSALVQFNHRMSAYVLLVFAVWHAFDMRRVKAGRGATHLALAISVQAIIGVVTLLLVVPMWAGLLHQIFAALLLIVGVMHAEKLARARRVLITR
jgi:heme a synthase